MKKQIQVSLIAFTVGMMWSSLASATLLNSPATSGANNSSTGTNLVSIVADGCTMPKMPASRHYYYVDPVHGKITNNGSEAAPWDTLANVVSKKFLTSIVKPGDVIYLMTGNHGFVAISNIHNADFITIEAAPGQTPVLGYLTMSNVEKFIIHGLKFQSLKNGDWHSLFSVGASNFAATSGTSRDIIFDGNLVSTQDDISTWTQADWLSKARSGIVLDGRSSAVPDAPTSGVTCTTITNNMITHVTSTVGLGTDHTLFSGNTINDFGDDAIDYDANNLTISNNVITNSEILGDGVHTDAMQGQLHKGPGYDSTDVQKYSNISITGNLIISQTDPNLKYPNPGLQGIDAFDSDWTNVSVTNNTVIVTAYHGISFSSVHNAIISNNTVMPAGTLPTWIDVGSQTHEGLPSTNVIAKNNIAWTLTSNMDASVFSNNIVGNEIAAQFNGKGEWITKPGTYGNNNRIVSDFMQNFVLFNNTNKLYNLTPVANSLMKGYGSTVPTTVNLNIPGAMAPQITQSTSANGQSPTYSGTITLHANARQIGTPKLEVLIDGVTVGSAVITANVHTGQIGVYSLNYKTVKKPQKVDVVMSGYASTVEKYEALGLYNFEFNENDGHAADLLRTTTGQIKSGQITLQPWATFETNGSTLEFNVSNLPD